MVEVEVDTAVVFEVARGDRIVSFKIVEGGEDVAQSQHLSHEHDEAFLFLLRRNRANREWEVKAQLVDGFQVAGQVLAVRAQENLAARLFVAEEGNRVVCCLFEVAEADNVSVCLHRVEDSVRARESLDEAVSAQVLIDP